MESKYQRIYFGLYDDEILCDLIDNIDSFEIKSSCSHFINWYQKYKNLFNTKANISPYEIKIIGNFNYKILLDLFIEYLNSHYWIEWNNHKSYWYCLANERNK